MKKITHTLLLVTDLVKGRGRNHVLHKGIYSKSPLSVVALIMLITLVCISNAQSQNVNIPDANFKAYLVGNTSINTNADSEIQVSEATAFTGLIDCSNLNIADLTGIEAFTNITQLYCQTNQLTSLDISQNTELFSLQCYDNSLTSLDVSNNSDLIFLYAFNNPIGSLDVSNNTVLQNMYIQNTQLSSLDVSQNTSLSQLQCQDNQLTTLNLGNTGIEYIWCYNNQLTELDVSQSSSLIDLRFYNNQLTSLDVSQNSNMTILLGNDNDLTELNVANGNNANFSQFDVTNNSGLDCIQVDDATYSTNNWTNIDASASFSESCPEWCTVNIPDANFKAYLVGNTSINTNGDSEIQCEEASSFTGAINCKDLNVADLTGLEAFTSLTQLICGGNPSLTSMDVSQNTALFSINVNSASLTSLDVSNNTSLKFLHCYNNNLTALDLSQNTSLLEINCGNNQITSLNVSNNTSLTRLLCYSNQLTALDVSQNTQLTQLFFYGNQISEIDVTNNTALQYLYTFDNPISSLDVSNNPSLINLYSHESQLTSLDVSQNPNLVQLTCYNNELTELNVANGNNTNLTAFDATNNPNLICIEVDDAAYSAANWTDIDAGATFSEDCAATLCTIDIPDANFKAYLVGNASINTNGDGEIQCDEASNYSGAITASNQSISDLTGIEAFTALTTLTVFNNSITSVDLSNNTALTHLGLSNNQLTSLDLSNNTGLIQLQVKNNQLGALDVSMLTSLEYLDCATNQISELDLSNNLALTYLECDKNELSSLDLTQNTALTELFCTENLLTQLNVANGNNGIITFFYADYNPSLFCIQVDDAAYSASNWPNVDTQASFSEDCSGSWNFVSIPDANFKTALLANASINTIDDGEITFEEAEAYTGTIDVSSLSIADLTGIEAFTSITSLQFNSNSVTNLDLSNNSALTFVNGSNNQLTSIDISGLESLTEIQIGFNQLTTIDISTNSGLESLGVNDNLLNSLDVSNNDLLEVLYASGNNLTALDVSSNLNLVDIGFYDNPIVELDFSENSALVYLEGGNNALTSLNVANGNNSNFEIFTMQNNPNLTCITVDDVAYAEANFTDVDEAANFSTNCNNTANDILTFSFTEQAIDAIIDDINHTVVIDVVSGTDFTNLTPTFTVSAGASASPASGVAQDFSSNFVYTVTAENPTAIQEWTVTVREENTAPSDIALDNNAIDENNAVDAVVGTFSTTDADASDSHTYSLVAGTGDADNASFDVSGSDLIALESFDFETKSSYAIRLQTDDGRGGTFEKEFIISINDQEERSEQTITFAAIDDQFLEAGSITLSATASSGLAVNFNIVSGPATVSENVVSFTGLGTVIVSANQEGNADFFPADPVEQTFEIISVTGIDKEVTDALRVYPNPASQELNIQINQQDVMLQLLNLSGALVMDLRANIRNDISHLDNGVYFLRIVNAEGTTIQKVIKN